MGKKPFSSRDRLIKHEFDRLRLGLGLELWLGLWIATPFGVRVRVRVGIRVYVKTFCSAAKPYKP